MALDVALPIETTISVNIVTLYIYIYHTFIYVHISWIFFDRGRDSKTICEASTTGNWPITGNAAGLEAARRRHQWAVDSQRSTLSAGKLRHVSKPFFETLKQQSFRIEKRFNSLGPDTCHSLSYRTWKSLLKITQIAHQKTCTSTEVRQFWKSSGRTRNLENKW